MSKIRTLHVATFILLLFAAGTDTHALSTAAKSENDYIYLMHHLRDVQVMIDNFASDQQRQKYTDLTNDFRNASVDFYAHNFIFFDKNAKKYRMKFYHVKLKMSELLDEMAKAYIDRTSDILRTTSKDSFNILIKFTKGGYSKYFNRPIDPQSRVQGEKIYKTDEYHLYHDKATIEQYLRKGYKMLEDAKRIYDHPDMQTVKAKTEKNNYDVNYMVDGYLNVVKLCRQSKQYGIEIYRIIRKNNIYAIQKKYETYNIPITNPEPVFDVRIPENYKIDANDNIRLVHSHELKKLPADFPKSPLSDTQ
jgi:hypothetical protein